MFRFTNKVFEPGTVKGSSGSRFMTENVVVELFELFKHGTVKRFKGSRFKTANVVVELFELFKHGTVKGSKVQDGKCSG